MRRDGATHGHQPREIAVVIGCGRKPILLPIAIRVTNDGFSNNLAFRDHD
jgi:hypothetical protein